MLVSERRGFIGLSSKARRRLVDVGKQLGPFDGLSRFKKIQYLKAIAGSSTRRASAKSRSKTVPVCILDPIQYMPIHAIRINRLCNMTPSRRKFKLFMNNLNAFRPKMRTSGNRGWMMMRQQHWMNIWDALSIRQAQICHCALYSVLVVSLLMKVYRDREYSHTSRQTPEQPRAESFEVPRTPVRPGPHSLTLSPYSITGSFVDVHSGRLSPISVTPDVLCRDLMGEPVGSPDSWDGDANSDDGLYEERGNQQTRMDGGLLSPRATSPQRPETRQPHSSDDMPDEFDEDLEGLIQDCPPQPNNHYVSPPEIEELRKKLAEAEADLERWKAKEAQTTDVYFTQTTKLATTRCELEETNVELKSLREYLARVENGAEWQGESARDRVIGLEAELRQVSRELAAAKEKIQAAMEAMGPGQSVGVFSLCVVIQSLNLS